MVIHQIEPVNKKKSRIVFDTSEKIIMYNNEINKLNLETGMDLSDELYDSIKKSILYPRAREKALRLIEISSKSESELSRKLSYDGFPQDVINQVVNFLNEYSLINDYNYAINYYNYNKTKKSYRQIIYELKNKGIDKSVIEKYLEENNTDTYEDEEKQIIKYISKYREADGNIPADKKMKIAAKLYRKGFSGSIISKIISDMF